MESYESLVPVHHLKTTVEAHVEVGSWSHWKAYSRLLTWP